MIAENALALKLATFALALVLALAALRGYRRSSDRAMLWVAAGFVLLGLGPALEGMAVEFAVVSLYQASIVHTGCMIAGMAAILLSIYRPLE
ncbi:MAG: DUF5985 family protein [Natrialbaceae archaeon]|nr:DUF5985 family protein [Natrialbaceae archaeon]